MRNFLKSDDFHIFCGFVLLIGFIMGLGTLALSGGSLDNQKIRDCQARGGVAYNTGCKIP